MTETITYEIGGTVSEPKAAWVTITDSLGKKIASFAPMVKVSQNKFSFEFATSENVPVNLYHVQIITEKVIKVGN